jgi:spermidine/putrescine transport system permease protein
MIGNIIENFFKISFNYNMGSMVSLVVILVIMGAIVLLSKFDKEGETLI